MADLSVSGAGAGNSGPLYLSEFGTKGPNPAKEAHLPGSKYIKTILRTLLEIREKEISGASLDRRSVFLRTGQNAGDFKKTIEEVRRKIRENREKLEELFDFGLDPAKNKKDKFKQEVDNLLKEINKSVNHLEFSASRILKDIREAGSGPIEEKLNPNVAGRMLEANKRLAKSSHGAISPEKVYDLLR